MSRNGDHRPHRMPGPVVALLVIFGISAVFSLVVGILAAGYVGSLTLLLFVNAAVTLTLGLGLAFGNRWARYAGLAWYGLAVLVGIVAFMSSIGPSPTASAPEANPLSILFSFGIIMLLISPGTRAWCGELSADVQRLRGGSTETDRLDDEEELTYNDQVRLTEDLEEYGLRAGALGTVRDVLEDPDSYEVEFVDDRTETTASVVLLPEQLRFVEAPH